jgi:hypothetical protein
MAKNKTTYSMRTDVIALLEAAEKKMGFPKIRLVVRAVRGICHEFFSSSVKISTALNPFVML